MISNDVVILTRDDFQRIKDDEYARGVRRGKFEANSSGPGLSAPLSAEPQRSLPTEGNAVAQSPAAIPEGMVLGARRAGEGMMAGELGGYSMDNDARWMISTPEGDVGILTEYNSEITGFERRVHEIDPRTIHYGGNWYYVRHTLLPKLGYFAKRLEQKPSPPPSPQHRNNEHG